jgi:hypothetical protein
VVAAYRAFQPAPYDAPGQAMAAVLYAANQKAGYFQLSEPGTISVLDDGRTRFVPAANGKHRYLVVDAAQKEPVLKAYTELAATKPTPPAGRGFRPPQANPAADAAGAPGAPPAAPAAAGDKSTAAPAAAGKAAPGNRPAAPAAPTARGTQPAAATAGSGAAPTAGPGAATTAGPGAATTAGPGAVPKPGGAN